MKKNTQKQHKLTISSTSAGTIMIKFNLCVAQTKHILMPLKIPVLVFLLLFTTDVEINVENIQAVHTRTVPNLP